ncbi:MAG: O-acetyl-ADP-ribose deacetylase [Ignavibacteria bacterium]|nr:O-acetyl-ADP-ribose deacetylase [Ignavibacteria bacterium]
MSDRRIQLVKGDITQQRVDAIVNAANTSLRGGGGVDGAIHRAAGPGLLEECRTLGGCPTGDARITKGYDLPARYVIHTPGPVWQGGGVNEDALLASCYQSTFALLHDHNLKTVAFPSIGTGIYRFPIDRASRIALREIRRALNENPSIERVVIVAFDERTFDAYTRALMEESS